MKRNERAKNPYKALLTYSLALSAGVVVWVGCSASPGHWQKLADTTNSAGQRFVVAQEHYDRFEGWRVAFWFIADGKVYGSLLEMQTRPWTSVRLSETNGTLEIWKEGQLAGSLSLSNRVFSNLRNGSVDNYVGGFNGVQGKIAGTNLVFDQK